MKKLEKSFEFSGKKLTLSTGTLANQANGAVLATMGGTVVLATVVAVPMRQDMGYFPLSVEYQERLYAGGIIKGSRWVKREGKPTNGEILTARLIDRSIRPLFPKSYDFDDVQVIITVLSIDKENPPDMVASVAVSAALSISDIPWNGPVGILRVTQNDNKYLINPTRDEINNSDFDLVISLTKKAVVMVELGANQVSEKDILGGIKHARSEVGSLLGFINDFSKDVGVTKKPLEDKKLKKGLEKKVRELIQKDLAKLASQMATKEAGYAEYDQIKNAVLDNFEESDKKSVKLLVENIFEEIVRKSILSNKRLDGRKSDEVRELSASVSILPRTHGSGLFNRGQTQVLSIVTLGAPSLEQTIETVEGEKTKGYIHHYNFPPFSVGETGRVGFPKRREIGHGALAEKAILPVLPSKEEFPYTIRVVSEVLSSNGSTSMASTCGSTLSLMDAGVPIKTPVAGIAMGLVIEDEKNYVVLTDIAGIEDGAGDMDFKVAGTKNGITALQLDVKTLKLTTAILEDALEKAATVRAKILKVITKAINKPRVSVSAYAPNIKIVKIDESKIGDLIGPGGKTIKAIIKETGAQIDVEDDGSVFVSSPNSASLKSALDTIEGLTKEVVPGELYEGEVKRIENFGAFVGILPGKDGLVHVSDMSQDFVKDPNDLVKIGDKLKVRVKEVDNLGRINLSMLLDGDKKKNVSRQSGTPRHSDRNFSRGKNDRRSNNSRRRGVGQKSSGGPHFPTSRLIDMDNKKGFSR